MFVCITGADADGHDYAERAVERGARAVVCSRPLSLREDVAVVLVEDTRGAMAHMAAALYGRPADEMTLIGVTGTKGKTTTAFMIAAILKQAGHKAGLIGTVHIDTGRRLIESWQTTPESVEIQKYLREMADCGCTAAVIEVSSQALMLGRVECLYFDYGVFTNIEEDHIGPKEHENFADYIRCKSMLFRRCGVGIVNGDDPRRGQVLEGHTCSVETYGFGDGNDLQGFNFADVRIPGKLGVEFQIKGDYNINLVIPMPGRFTCYNAMAAIGVCRHFAAADRDIAQALREIRIPGRQEMFSLKNGGMIIVDYAHNGTALRCLLTALSAYRPTKLTCVFGCGGGRDRNRRFSMSEAACQCADFIVITSDNPRNESPDSIIDDIMEEVKRHDVPYAVVFDRKEAIDFAVSQCGPGEIVVVAGKGHESYQLIGDKKIHFDDREEVLASIEKVRNERNYSSGDRAGYEGNTPLRK